MALQIFGGGTAGAGGGTATSVVTTTAANSGTARTVTAPTHGEARLKLTLTGNATLTLNGGTAGEVCAVQLHLIQDATGSRTVTWPSNIDWGVNGAPVLSTTVGKVDRVYLTTDDGGANFQGALIGAGYTAPGVAAAPSAPTALSASAGATSAALTWTQGAANGATVTNNKVYRSTTTGTETLLTTIAAGTTYTDTGLTGGTTYFYKVTAVNSVGESALSSETSTTPGIVTAASDDFTAADSTTGIWSGAASTRSTPVGSKPWSGTAGSTWGISSNRAYKAASSTASAWIDAGAADATMQCDYTIGATRNDSGFVVRYADVSNRIIVMADPGGWYIQKVVGGTQSNVANAGTPAAATTYTVKVVCSGSSIQVYVNGTLTVSGTVADAALVAATKFGPYSNGGTDHFWDNFSVTTP